MEIIISNSSAVPIYEQIKSQIINQIITDELKSGDAIPSIRTLASDIKISVMTIKKAYDELENEGYIRSVQGKGTFVASKNIELARENANRKIEKHIEEIIEIANKFNINKKTLENDNYVVFRYSYK